MISLPITFTPVIGVFVPVFPRPVWQHLKVLLIEPILATGNRTITAILRVMGQADEAHFQTYHRVLNRAVWSPLAHSPEFCHPVHRKAATQSMTKRPPSPQESCRLIQDWFPAFCEASCLCQ